MPGADGAIGPGHPPQVGHKPLGRGPAFGDDPRDVPAKACGSQQAAWFAQEADVEVQQAPVDARLACRVGVCRVDGDLVGGVGQPGIGLCAPSARAWVRVGTQDLKALFSRQHVWGEGVDVGPCRPDEGEPDLGRDGLRGQLPAGKPPGDVTCAPPWPRVRCRPGDALNAAGPLISTVIQALARQVPTWHDNLRLIDSTPLPCAASRETVKRSELAGHAGYGYCRSHSRFFWRVRLHLLTTAEGMPVSWCLANPKRGEREVMTALLERDHHLVHSGQVILADKGFATGRTAKRLIDARVVLEAQRPLVHTDLPVAAIGRMLGFSEPTNFGKFLARETGHTPEASAYANASQPSGQHEAARWPGRLHGTAGRAISNEPHQRAESVVSTKGRRRLPRRAVRWRRATPTFTVGYWVTVVVQEAGDLSRTQVEAAGAAPSDECGTRRAAEAAPRRRQPHPHPAADRHPVAGTADALR